MPEERRISPALVIAGGLGLGLAGALGIYALTRAAPAPPPPPPDLANLYGKVIDAETGEALPGVQVVIAGIGTVTDDTGSYQLTDLEPGVWTVAFSTEGYQTAVYADMTLVEGNNEFNAELEPVPPPVGAPWEFTNAQCSLGTEFPGDWWQVDFSATITNVGGVPATKIVTLYERSFVPIVGGGFWTAWGATQDFELALAPGESYDFLTHLNTLYGGGEFYVGAKLQDSDGYESEPCQAP